MRRRRWTEERGQALTEYLMIVGLLAAIIISVTKVIVPVLSWMVLSIVSQVAVWLSSVPA